MSVEDSLSGIEVDDGRQFTLSEEEEIEEKRAIAEEPYDPDHPEDLVPEGEKSSQPEEDEEEGETLDSQDEDSREEQDDEDDSIVVGDDVVDYDCKDHDLCIKAAKRVDELIMTMFAVKSDQKERLSALVEVLCDHFWCK